MEWEKCSTHIGPGLRPKHDKRNRLIIPAVKIIKVLQPQWVVFENVSNMVNTVICDEMGELINIVDYIHRELGNTYIGKPQMLIAQITGFRNTGFAC